MNLDDARQTEEALALLLAEIDVNSVPVPPPIEGSLSCSLTDPVKQTDGMTPYMTYKVTTDSDRPNFNNRPQVIRRYNDFTWFRQTLEDDFPGAVIPALPKKNLADRFRDEFIRMRMRTLEQFLTQVGQHPELARSPTYHTFLTADATAFVQARAARQVARQAAGAGTGPAAALQRAGGVTGLFQRGLAQAKAMVGPAAGYAAAQESAAAKSPADVRFEEVAQYVQALEVNLENVLRHAAQLVRRARELAAAENEFGLAFTMLAETEAGQLGGLLNAVGGAADKTSRRAAAAAEAEAVVFEEPLGAYVGLVRAVRAALQAREDRRQDHLQAINDVEARRMAHAKVHGLPGREVEAAGAKHAVEMSIEAAKVKKRLYEETSARVIREVEQFKAKHANAIKRIVLDYINLQIDHQTKVLQIYQPLVADEGFRPLGPPPPPGGGAGAGGGGVEARPAAVAAAAAAGTPGGGGGGGGGAGGGGDEDGDLFPPSTHVGLLAAQQKGEAAPVLAGNNPLAP